ELRALYVLQVLTVEAERVATEASTRETSLTPVTTRTAHIFDEQLTKIAEEITRLQPTERERAEAIDAVGTRLAGGYRAERARLKAFEAAEVERDRLAVEARDH